VNGIECRELWKIYSNDAEAIRDLSLSLKAGKMYVIAGPNGAGKTTFLRMISTELLPTRGKLLVLGHDVSHERLAIQQGIGVMPQEARLYHSLTTWEHIYYFTLLKGLTKGEAKEETERILELLKLQGIRKTMVDHLSGGQRRQVSLAQAIAGRFDLLLLDEPTTGLDPEARRNVWDVIKTISLNKKTIIVTTHYLDEVQAIADGAIIFDKGRIVTKGGVNEVMAKIGYEAEIEVECRKDVEKALNDLEPSPKRGVKNGKMVIWVKKNELERVIGALTSCGVRFSEITISRPSLEEIYLDILRSKNEC
jgi:ABC-2 type transport system ATP-binding protein